MGDHSVIRLMRELHQLEKHDQLAYTVHYNEASFREIDGLILGPPETPYAFGFYHFLITIPNDYPRSPPSVILKTTNRGRTRFGPNLYANGKVCLSILGTWRGESGEEWSPAQGIESVLLSIQSLLSSNPYFNEPGYEEQSARSQDAEQIQLYSDKITHENIRLTVLDPLELAMGVTKTSRHQSDDLEYPGSRYDGSFYPNPFIDYCKKRFLWYRDHYKQVVQHGIDTHQSRHHQEFPELPFETDGNSMCGEWDFVDLLSRIQTLENIMMQEITGWPSAGLTLDKAESGLAASLRAQHEQVSMELKNRIGDAFDLTLVDNNPFLWLFTMFGRPMTQYEGGVFRIKIFISPQHPIEQPRVFVETPIFHVRVSLDKMLIYLPSRADELIHHVQGIYHSLEEESPPFNPMMTVNAEATKLCWGSEDERREYKRKLRRSVADSADQF